MLVDLCAPNLFEPPMDEQSLYWTLSTLPQVCAALVAFIGFLILQSLDEPNRRREFFEKTCRRCVIGHGTTQESTLHAASEEMILGMAPDTFMTHFEGAVVGRQIKGRAPEWASDYLDRWKKTDAYLRSTRLRLCKFVGLNLGVIMASLLLLPIVPQLAKDGLVTGLVLGTSGIAVLRIAWIAGEMIFAAVRERRL